jgi:integrase/recombinase XerC
VVAGGRFELTYAARTRRPPTTLTDDEVRRLLAVSGKSADGFRDHVIFSLALGSGLREFEIVALDVGDVLTEEGGIRKRIKLRTFKGSEGARDERQRVHLAESTYYKLEKLVRVEKLGEFYRTAPLFWSRKGNRLSVRAVRGLFARWQKAARFDELHNFHRLRHTAITLFFRRTRDIRLTQKFARHASIETTLVYEHSADEELAAAVRDLPV